MFCIQRCTREPWRPVFSLPALGISWGKASGARSIALLTGEFSRAQLAEHAPDFSLEDFSEVQARMAELGW